MRYAIYQIKITKSQFGELDRARQNEEPIPKFFTDYWDLRMEPSEELVGQFIDKYSLVAFIDAEDLNEVFEIGNFFGDQKKLRRIYPMSSVSVGDLIADGNGNIFVVDLIGFKQIQNQGHPVHVSRCCHEHRAQ